MIIIKFHGGLGNQMYQYCFYQYIKKELPNAKVKADLDRYIFKRYIEHNGFELTNIFDNLEINVATTREIIQCGGEYERHHRGILDIILRMILNTFRNRRKSGAIYEGDINIEDLLLRYTEETDNLWLCGYWIGKKFKVPVCKFTFKNGLNSTNQKILDKIYLYNSVSIHVRKGDYVTEGLEVVTMDYYFQAVDIMRKKTENPHFFIFSDDKEFIKNNFPDTEDFTIVSNNVGNDSYKDMQLMSCCMHNIICNSTFSTWAALLNNNNNKIVILPKEYERSVPNSVEGEWIAI